MITTMEYSYNFISTVTKILTLTSHHVVTNILLEREQKPGLLFSIEILKTANCASFLLTQCCIVVVYQLLSTNNVKDLSNLGKFIKHGFDLRCNLI